MGEKEEDDNENCLQYQGPQGQAAPHRPWVLRDHPGCVSVRGSTSTGITPLSPHPFEGVMGSHPPKALSQAAWLALLACL